MNTRSFSLPSQPALALVLVALAAPSFGCAAQRAQRRFDDASAKYVPTLVEDLPPPDSKAYPTELGEIKVDADDFAAAQSKTSVLCDRQRGVTDGATGDWAGLLSILDIGHAPGQAVVGNFPISGWKLEKLTIRCDQFAINDVAIKPDLVIAAGNFGGGGTGKVIIAASVFALNYSTGDALMTVFSGELKGTAKGQGSITKSTVVAGNLRRYLDGKTFVRPRIFAPNIFSGTLPDVTEVYLPTSESPVQGLWLGARKDADYWNVAKLKKE